MRESNELKRNKQKELEIQTSENVKIVLEIFDSLIAGQRFGELDSSKQMYLLGCQSKIEDMKQGYYTEDSLEFLCESIKTLLHTVDSAIVDVQKICKEFEEG